MERSARDAEEQRIWIVSEGHMGLPVSPMMLDIIATTNPGARRHLMHGGLHRDHKLGRAWDAMTISDT